MTEFLTENARRAYPLEHEWPAGLRERWTGVLVDACVYASDELGPGSRISLLSVRRDESSLVFRVGIPEGAGLDVTVTAGRQGFITAFSESDSLKAILALDGRKVDAIIRDSSDSSDPTAATTVNIPFAARCAGGAIRRVTAITAQGPAVCEKPLYSLSDPNKTELSFSSGEHAVLKADDGVDLDVTRMAPVVGDMLRISAIAAPTAVDIEEEPIDMVIRGDECFTIDAEPGVRAAANGAIVTTGVVRIGNTCKPCCQCEDYKEAVELLKPAEEATWGLNGLLDAVKTKYDAALQAFNAAKARILAQVNSPDNVRITLAAASSCNIYSGSDASGSRQRVTVTFLAENMTMVNATVSGTSISVAGFSVCSTSGQLTGTMPPGGTLMAAVTYAKPNTTSNAVPAMPSISGTCTVRVGSQTAARSLSAS